MGQLYETQHIRTSCSTVETNLSGKQRAPVTTEEVVIQTLCRVDVRLGQLDTMRELTQYLKKSM